MKWQIFFLILFIVPFVSSYSVNQPITVQTKLQWDNGVSTSDVTIPACILSVYSFNSNDFIVRDGLMSNGSYHEYTFVPLLSGTYTVSTKCSYLNETGIFYENFEVLGIVTNPSSGGSVLNLNANISTSKDLYVVNLEGDTVLDVPVQYFVNGQLSNSRQAEWTIIRDDNVLNRGLFTVSGLGKYNLNFDARDYVEGDYKVVLFFDGKNKVVDFKVTSVPVNFITGYVISDATGNIIVWRLWLIIIIILLILIAIILFFKGRRKKEKND